MTKSSATSQIEGKNKTIDYKKLYQEQAKKHQLMLSQIPTKSVILLHLSTVFFRFWKNSILIYQKTKTGLKSWKIWIFSEVCLVSFPVTIILSD